MSIIYLLLGVIIGALLMFLWLKSKSADVIAKANEQVVILRAQLETSQNTVKQQIETERQHSEELRRELKKESDAKLQLMQEEIKNITTQMLNESREQMNNTDKERLESLLSPLKERLETFTQTVHNNSKEGAANKTELKTSFEEALKRLHSEQENIVRTLREDHERALNELRQQTEKIGNDAASLTQALKGDSKLQGDWGEMILEKTLEDCGLIKDQQYFLQENFKDVNGNNYRPDAVIVFPNNERAVVDAKVSLTAYHEAVKSDDDKERERLLKEHVLSVRKHIDELSDKNYESLVPGCIGFVLMFLPYESGYSAALKTDPSLLQYAYRKHIIMLSPSNLLMALQLTHTMWQNYRLNQNVEEILRQSNDLYDKFVTFGETFIKLGAGIQRLQQDYDKAQGQLRDGKGNIIRRLENMKLLGITPKKQIPDDL